jgi:hypothetical protein
MYLHAFVCVCVWSVDLEKIVQPGKIMVHMLTI